MSTCSLSQEGQPHKKDSATFGRREQVALQLTRSSDNFNSGRPAGGHLGSDSNSRDFPAPAALVRGRGEMSLRLQVRACGGEFQAERAKVGCVRASPRVPFFPSTLHFHRGRCPVSKSRICPRRGNFTQSPKRQTPPSPPPRPAPLPPWVSGRTGVRTRGGDGNFRSGAGPEDRCRGLLRPGP